MGNAQSDGDANIPIVQAGSEGGRRHWRSRRGPRSHGLVSPEKVRVSAACTAAGNEVSDEHFDMNFRFHSLRYLFLGHLGTKGCKQAIGTLSRSTMQKWI